jgi:hypothetical protein
MKRSGLLVALSALLAACDASTREGDPMKQPVLGSTPECLTNAAAEPSLIECQRNPVSPSRRDPAAQPRVDIQRAVVTAIDNYDETRDGKGRGAVYVQDVSSSRPYSGVSLYRPSLLPSSSTPAPGDVFQLVGGQYQENKTIGSTVDFGDKYLPQIAFATGNFAFEYVPPPPAAVSVADLSTWESGKAYVGMLVTLSNVTIDAWKNDGKGRVTGALGAGRDAPALSNELMDVEAATQRRTTFKSVTGVVTFFFNLKVAPRSAADFQF